MHISELLPDCVQLVNSRVINAINHAQENALAYLREKFPDCDDNVFFSDSYGRHKTMFDFETVNFIAARERICPKCKRGTPCELASYIENNGRNLTPYIDIKTHAKGFRYMEIKHAVMPVCRHDDYDFTFERLFDESGLTKRERSMTFGKYKHQNQEQLLAMTAAMKFAKDGTGNLILAGKRGTGKTHLAIAVILARMKLMKQSCRFVTVAEMLDILRQSAVTNLESFFALMNEYKTVDCLVLDDWGKEKQTAAGLDYLYQIVDYRYRHELQTIVTTNARTLNELISWSNAESIAPMLSRLMQNGQWVAILHGNDYRLTGGTENE